MKYFVAFFVVACVARTLTTDLPCPKNLADYVTKKYLQLPIPDECVNIVSAVSSIYSDTRTGYNTRKFLIHSISNRVGSRFSLLGLRGAGSPGIPGELKVSLLTTFIFL
jgi:hypothetical protein